VVIVDPGRAAVIHAEGGGGAAVREASAAP
jgi:hypothetical protein